MPRYFIDTVDGAKAHRDDEGEHFETIEMARQAVVAMLPGLVDEIGPDDESRLFVATLRNERDETLYVAKLRFDAQWTVSAAAAE